MGQHILGVPIDLYPKSILHKHIWERQSGGGGGAGSREGMETPDGAQVINSTDSAIPPTMSEVISDGAADKHCSEASNV